MTPFDLPGTLRRIRRTADLSQRELARTCGVAPTVVSRAETGDRDLPLQLFTRFAAVAGFHLVVLDGAGSAVAPMQPGAVRDAAGRLFPAHLDTRHGDEDWWGGPHRPRLRQPRYTYDQRDLRDARRSGRPAPGDHHARRPGDSLAERAEARREARTRELAQERERRLLDGTLGRTPEPFTCSCPPGCDYDEEENEDMAHAADCACRCDVS